MLSLVFSALALAAPSLPAASSFEQVSDSDLIALLANGDLWDEDVALELNRRARTHAPSQRAELVALLVGAAEGSPSDRVVVGAAVVLVGIAEMVPSEREVIGAHMRRIIVQQDPARAFIIMEYVATLTKFDHSEETRTAIEAVLANQRLLDGDHRLQSVTLEALGSFGAQNEAFLIRYFPKSPDEAATALGVTGGDKAFRFLRKQARDRSGGDQRIWIRWECTRGLGVWASVHPAGSAKRNRAVRTLQSLACEQAIAVKKTALKELERLGVAPRPCGEQEDGDDDDEDDDRDDERGGRKNEERKGHRGGRDSRH
ncbi:MAG: hypothetical protein HY904_18920 [Deltaproteobacteria bacterium]|nr:hypothetical protein [Deltaproteobacteria bacterium]